MPQKKKNFNSVLYFLHFKYVKTRKLIYLSKFSACEQQRWDLNEEE